MARRLIFAILTVFMLLGGVVLLINVRAQAPKKAQILFHSNREGPDINKMEGLEIFVMDTDGSNQRKLTNSPERNRNAVWSPDGQRIAFTSWRDGNFEVYVMDADGDNPRNLTNYPGYDYGPEWSPDGQMIAFFSRRDGNDEIYVMDADGDNPRRLTNSPGQDLSPSWSPDSQRIAFCSERDGNDEIYVMDINRKTPRRLTNNPAVDGHPSWSPDGQRIAFSRTDTPGGVWDGKSSEIYVMDADGSNPRRLTNNPAWDGINDWFDPAFASVSPAGKLRGTWGEIRRGR